MGAGREIVFVWVKAHCGIEPNEYLHQMTKQAIGSNEVHKNSR